MVRQQKTKAPKVVKSFLSYMSSVKGATKGTVNGYESDLILFLRFMKIQNGIVDEDTPYSEIEVSDIDKNFMKEIELGDVYEFLSYLENERGNSNTTRARKIACLKSFFRYLYRKAKIIDYDISGDLETPSIEKKKPVFLNLDESKKLLQSITGRNVKRDTCIVTLFLNTGMRLSELCSINISAIKGDTLVITGKGNKERFVYLNNACLNSIDEYMKVRELWLEKVHEDCFDALFLSEQKKRISKRAVEDIVNNAIKNAGLSSKYSTHKLRHTAATLMYRAGADIRSIQEILGHESVSTTQIYTHVMEDQLRNAVHLNPLNDETRTA